MKLTPKHDHHLFSPNPANTIRLRDDLLVELDFMEYYDIITTLPFLKSSSPVFAQRQSLRKLRILINFRRINHLIGYDYKNNYFVIPTMADKTANLAGKQIFSKKTVVKPTS